MNNSLLELIGREHVPEYVAESLKRFAVDLAPAAIGAYQLTCSDETERRCEDVFQRLFVEDLLPPLRPNQRSPFRSINLGARYERGAIRVAEEHYATEAARSGTKLIVAKINAHVAARPSGDDWEYGSLLRYHRGSTCCGALGAMLDGAVLPALEELRHTFQAGGVDRLGALRNPQYCPAPYRALLAAVASARLQADRLVLDTREFTPESPTLFLVLACVNINRPEADGELVVGHYGVDWAGSRPEVQYSGLGSDPAHYRVVHDRGLLTIDEPA